MCGIIGYVGNRPCRELILAGLERLEYRGYDSAGFALLDGTDRVAESVRAVGNLARLRAAAGTVDGTEATVGLGHTRWATHGRVTEENAHPHASVDGTVWVVMNGIIENYRELRSELQDAGVVFASDTDTEVIPQLIAQEYAGDLAATVRAILPRLGGHFAFVAGHVSEPERLVAARRECPLVVGVGDGERFVASAIPAFLHETRDVVALQDDEVVVLEADGHRIWSGGELNGDRPAERVEWDEDAAEKGGYETFMLKEIHEQPTALWDTIGDRLGADGSVRLPGVGLDDAALARVERVHIVACGTSHHAGLVGRYLIEDWARIPVQVEVASEYRYRTCLAGPGDLILGITQSGETADTLAAMRVARERGAHVVALTNIMGSQATRDADGVLYTRAGIDPFAALPITAVALFVLGYAIQRGILNLVIRAPMFNTLLITFGIDVVLAYLAQFWFSADFRAINPRYAGANFTLGPVTLPTVQVAAFVIAISLTVALWLFLLHTRIGRGIRAAAQNLVAARLYGVSPRSIYAFTFGLGAALAGVAGGLYGMVSQINPYIGGPLTAKSFVIAIIGGLDNPLGVIVGGLALGIIESLTALYVGPTYRDVASFGILVLVLIVRPTGLLGRTA